MIRPKIRVLWIEIRSMRPEWALLLWAHLHEAAAKQCASVAAMHCGCLWVWFYTFDRPDLDAIPSGLSGRLVVGWGGRWGLPLHCTVFWLSAEHDPGLNVTGISELCTMQTFGSETACRDQEMHQLILMWRYGGNPKGGKTEFYFHCTENRPALARSLARSLSSELLPG